MSPPPPPQLLSRSSAANWTVKLIVRPPVDTLPDADPAEVWCFENVPLNEDGHQTWYSYLVGWYASGEYAFMFHFERHVDAIAFKMRWG